MVNIIEVDATNEEKAALRKIRAQLQAKGGFSPDQIKKYGRRIAGELLNARRDIDENAITEALARLLARESEADRIKAIRIVNVLKVAAIIRAEVTDARAETVDMLAALVAYHLEQSGDFRRTAVLAVVEEFRRTRTRLFSDEGLKAFHTTKTDTRRDR